jgi:hypothetical protein
MPQPPEDSGMDADPDPKILSALDNLKDSVDELVRSKEANGKSGENTKESEQLVNGMRRINIFSVIKATAAYQGPKLTSVQIGIMREMLAVPSMSNSEERDEVIRQLCLDLLKTIPHPDAYAALSSAGIHRPETHIAYGINIPLTCQDSVQLLTSLFQRQHSIDTGAKMQRFNVFAMLKLMALDLGKSRISLRRRRALAILKNKPTVQEMMLRMRTKNRSGPSTENHTTQSGVWSPTSQTSMNDRGPSFQRHLPFKLSLNTYIGTVRLSVSTSRWRTNFRSHHRHIPEYHGQRSTLGCIPHVNLHK